MLELDANILGAFFVEQGHLLHWRMREGLKLPEPEKVGALMFQRTLIHSMLQAREEYVGKMHFNLTSYDQMDIFHFSLDGPKDPIMLVTVKKAVRPRHACATSHAPSWQAPRIAPIDMQIYHPQPELLHVRSKPAFGSQDKGRHRHRPH
jgi:hypothetical protein